MKRKRWLSSVINTAFGSFRLQSRQLFLSSAPHDLFYVVYIALLEVLQSLFMELLMRHCCLLSHEGVALLEVEMVLIL